MKNREIAALANVSRDLLLKGDAIGAERVLSPVFNQLKTDDVTVLHLMGLIMKAQNRLDQAERYLRGAVANALQEGPYYNDLAVVLQARGAFPEATRIFRAAIALMPEIGVTRTNLIRCLMAAGNFKDAEREARIFIAVTPCAEAWNMLAAVQRAMERREEALGSAEAALAYDPKDRALRHNHAVSLDRAGRVDEAIGKYEELAQEAMDSPDLTLNFARALYARRRKQDAEAVLEEAVKHWPTAGPLHSALARMRCLRGEGEAATVAIEAEITRRPNDYSLYLICADALHRGGCDAKAERILQEALRRAPEIPALLTALGIVLDELNRPEEGLVHLRKALALTGNSGVSHRNMLSTLLRAGRPEEALKVTRALRAHDPDEQYLIASEAIALRMLGEPEYRRLYDYQRFVRSYDVKAPRGFFNAENFNAALADCLRAMHRTWAHPLDQSLHEGTQTGRSLLTVEEPNLKAWLGAVDESIRSYIADLKPAPDEPLPRRRQDRYRFSGCWSVRLTKSGFQPNHVHDSGWISAAYYASLPANMGGGNSGWLKFGEPSRPIVSCGPEHALQPKTGTLVLFPSYMWHGTFPFETNGERLSAAFDVIPA